MFRRKFVTMKLFTRAAASTAACLIICHLGMFTGLSLHIVLLGEWFAFLTFSALYLLEREDRIKQVRKFEDGHTELVDAWDEATGLPIRERVVYRFFVVDPNGATKSNV